MGRYEDKFISMKKVFRLVCYKQRKESKPEHNRPLTIAQICPFKFKEINECCKHCRWFQVQDQTKEISQSLMDKGVSKDETILVRLQDFDELEFDPSKPIEGQPK